jgi:7-keto-8-aminopelargonate synthetase-like enzyme
VPLRGNDGKDYPEIVFEGVQGKTVRTYMANAALAVSQVMPDEENLRIRLGGEINRLQAGLKELEQRKERAEQHIEVMARREAGEPV